MIYRLLPIIIFREDSYRNRAKMASKQIVNNTNSLLSALWVSQPNILCFHDTVTTTVTVPCYEQSQIYCALISQALRMSDSGALPERIERESVGAAGCSA